MSPAATATQASYRFDLSLTAPLSLNNRRHWRAHARAVAAVREETTWRARAARIPALTRIAVELHYAPRDARRRDPLNLVATLKPVEDGLVDAGVVPDDTPEFVQPTMPVVDAPTRERTGRLYVVVYSLVD